MEDRGPQLLSASVSISSVILGEFPERSQPYHTDYHTDLSYRLNNMCKNALFFSHGNYYMPNIPHSTASSLKVGRHYSFLYSCSWKKLRG